MLLVEATIETAVIICIICGIASFVGFLVDKKAQKKIDYEQEKVRLDG
ncbi:hypothetical protein [Metabacillus endolithicus]|uniref:Uncharacterized protein n=1 Tax=Metabacillus endolithicus TaxID=1535204 RepID=A0ABW5C4X2_9BACI|nr:hypothetical protein [Metabacillus endolithicus]UPG63892.1 hypothetical protein MVE64_01675 [Metabacillus endolithicus]